MEMEGNKNDIKRAEGRGVVPAAVEAQVLWLRTTC